MFWIYAQQIHFISTVLKQRRLCSVAFCGSLSKSVSVQTGQRSNLRSGETGKCSAVWPWLLDLHVKIPSETRPGLVHDLPSLLDLFWSLLISFDLFWSPCSNLVDLLVLLYTGLYFSHSSEIMWRLSDPRWVGPRRLRGASKLETEPRLWRVIEASKSHRRVIFSPTSRTS